MIRSRGCSTDNILPSLFELVHYSLLNPSIILFLSLSQTIREEFQRPIVLSIRHGIWHKLYRDTCFWKHCYPKILRNFHSQEENIFYPYVTLIYFYTHVYTDVTYFFYLLGLKIRQEDFKIATRGKFTTNSICSKLYFTPRR